MIAPNGMVARLEADELRVGQFLGLKGKSELNSNRRQSSWQSAFGQKKRNPGTRSSAVTSPGSNSPWPVKLTQVDHAAGKDRQCAGADGNTMLRSTVADAKMRLSSKPMSKLMRKRRPCDRKQFAERYLCLT
jgi:hypothetical protein